MIFDTDILIYIQKKDEKAAELVERSSLRSISIYSYMELLQGAENKSHHRVILDFLKSFNFTILPLTENIGHRAAIYIEEYAISNGLRAGDALIAATAIENNLVLHSSNARHFKFINELQFSLFKPSKNN